MSRCGDPVSHKDRQAEPFEKRHRFAVCFCAAIIHEILCSAVEGVRVNEFLHVQLQNPV
jgi:hypothetical protein